MKNKIDLTELLKGCPKGTKFYSPYYGDVVFKEFNKCSADYPVVFEITCKKGTNANRLSCTEYGYESIEYENTNALPTVVPSVCNFDWSTFKPTWIYNDDHKHFVPYDKVPHKEY